MKSSREALDRETIQKRLLLCLYGLGTNTGLQRISNGTPNLHHHDLRYIKRRFVHKEALRQAITQVANAIFQIRLPQIWGEGTTTCASDSTKFGAWDQNLMTEWHVRYGGRGVMIYWHVEKNSTCIYSQLKTCSSSEVAAMIEGVLRHDTEMTVKKNFVDSHGQSEVAFAFCHLLGFQLMPRLKAIKRQKLYRLAKYLREERPDYNYLKSVFRHLRTELEVEVPKAQNKLPNIPSEEEIKRYYDAVWQARNVQDMVIIKTLLYTGVRVSELVNIKLENVDFERCQIRINDGKGGKDRIVPFPISFKEVLAIHIHQMSQKKATYLFESSWKRKYSTRGIHKILAKYAEAAELSKPISPHQLRHFLLTWLKKQGIDDALIQPYSGHSSRQSLEVYSRLSIGEAQEIYEQAMLKFPV